MDHGIVYGSCGHQYDIARLQVILAALHYVADISGQKEEQLVEIMIVRRERPFPAVGIIEEPEVFRQISGFIDLFRHELPPDQAWSASGSLFLPGFLF